MKAVNFGTVQGAAMPCGLESNRRYDVALAMRRRLQWFVYLRALGLRKGDDWLTFYSIADTHTHPFNGPFSGTTQVSWYQKGKTNLDFTEAKESKWQWHQLGHIQVCILLQTDNHTSTPPLCLLQAGCPSCRPTNSIKALKTV